jgi:butyrate response factor 1
MNYSYSPEFNQNNQTYIHLSESQIKNNIPFIPKALKFKHNNNQNNGNVLQNINLEEKFKSNDINKIIIPMNNTSDNHRKNSAGAESYSTCDEMSPVKPKKTKEKKTFPKKNKKKKGNKSPFKGEAKDFKIKYKTELCKYYECNGYCKYGDKCAYAHGIENLRSKVTNTTAYRTKKCTQFFEQGYCPYGNRCQFAHQLKSNIINNPYDKGMTYTKILETISKLENVGNIKKLVEKPRLAIFEEICKDEEGNESRLLDDIKKLNKSGLYKRVDNQN